MFLQINEIQAKLRKDYTLVEGISRRELDFKILYDLEKVTNGQFVGHACLISLACWVNYSFIPLLWVEQFKKIKKWYLSVYSSGFHLFIIFVQFSTSDYLFMIKYPIECLFFSIYCWTWYIIVKFKHDNYQLETSSGTWDRKIRSR